MWIKICADCRVEMSCFKNGVAAVYGDFGHCYAGDLYVCPRCGHKLLFCNEAPHNDQDRQFHQYYMKMNSGTIDTVENPFKLRANRFLEEIKVEHEQEPVTIKITRPTPEEILEWAKDRKEEKSDEQEAIQQDTEPEEGGGGTGDLHPNDSAAEQEQHGDRAVDTPATGVRDRRHGSRYNRPKDGDQ